jgi:hypothetical protein
MRKTLMILSSIRNSFSRPAQELEYFKTPDNMHERMKFKTGGKATTISQQDSLHMKPQQLPSLDITKPNNYRKLNKRGKNR